MVLGYAMSSDSPSPLSPFRTCSFHVWLCSFRALDSGPRRFNARFFPDCPKLCQSRRLQTRELVGLVMRVLQQVSELGFMVVRYNSSRLRSGPTSSTFGCSSFGSPALASDFSSFGLFLITRSCAKAGKCLGFGGGGGRLTGLPVGFQSLGSLSCPLNLPLGLASSSYGTASFASSSSASDSSTIGFSLMTRSVAKPGNCKLTI